MATANVCSREAELFLRHKCCSLIALPIKSFTASVFLSPNIDVKWVSGCQHPFFSTVPPTMRPPARQCSTERGLSLQPTRRHRTESVSEAQPAARGGEQRLTRDLGSGAHGCPSCWADGGHRRCSRCNGSADLAKVLLTFPTPWEPLFAAAAERAAPCRGPLAARPARSPAGLAVPGSVWSQPPTD